MVKALAAVAALLISTSATAQVVDGSYDAAYGAARSSVGYDPAAPLGDFANPGPVNHAAAYDIFLTTTATHVFGFIQADRVTGLQFANLYWDLDPANANGSDLGFEITNDRAFVPGMAGNSAPLAGLDFALSGDGLAIEFSIENSLFTGPIAGLTYYPGQEYPGLGDDIVLRISQSFGYSAAGGPTYGADRLGRVTIGAAAVPESSTWAMMILGMGMLGAGLRRRRAALAFA